ncbi:MAG: RCC1 domain-containing protein [Sandaracinaceae bacterium]
MRNLAIPLLVLLILSGCGEDQTLIVNVLTDFTRGRDFTSVRTELLPIGGTVEEEETRVVEAAARLAAFRVAELTDVPTGEWMVRATLLDEAGSPVSSGRVQIQLRNAPQTVTVVITRDCVGVMCDGQAVCVGGECVDPTCSPEQPDACPDMCSSDDACVTSGPDCVVGQCAEGICFEVADDTLCGGGICEAQAGCTVVPVDAGPADAGPRDGGPDGGPDTGPPDAGPPPPLSGVIGLALGDGHTCAQLETERRCWGANDQGQHGDGTTTSTTRPGPPIASSASGLRSGANHMCVNTVACWGQNDDRQLGSPTTAPSTSPLDVLPAEDISGPLALGRSHTCAPETGLCVSPGPCNFDIFCWGSNQEGQLGDGSSAVRDAPVRVDTQWQVVDAAGGDKHTCMISFEGLGRYDLFCWGANSFGQLGDSTLDRRTSPVQVTMPASPTEVVAGANHTCARAGGDVYCFGDNRRGQIDGAEGSRLSEPTQVTLPGAAESITAGGAHTCVVVAGRVYCWGGNDNGQLGDGTTTERGTPTEVMGIDSADSVYAGLAHTCAVLTDESVMCWGLNADGQLGDGTTEQRTRPVLVRRVATSAEDI